MNKSSFPPVEPRTTLIAGGQVLNVYTGELVPADIVIEGGRIARVVAPGEVWDKTSPTASPGAAEAHPAVVIDASDRVIVPGYVEPHGHLGLMAEPVQTLEQMAVTGTTTVVADTYPFMVSLSDDELADMLDRFQELPVSLRWFLAPHARSFLEGEHELFSLERLEKFLQRADVVAIGEFTRWPAVEQGDPDLLSKIARARALGKRVEGHGAGASPTRLQRLVKHGITSDHEAITAEQVLERLRVGLYTMLRHSSLRPDLPALIEAVRGELAHTNRLMLTVDGPTPSWMAANGYMDTLVRLAMEGGVEPAAAYRMATLNPAMYYGIEGDVGSIAPGRRADLLILRDLADPTPERVLTEGRVIAEGGSLVRPFPRVPWDTFVGLQRPPGKAPSATLFRVGSNGPETGADGRLEARDERIPILDMAHTVILRGGGGKGPAVQVALYDWRGRWVTRAFVTGFAERLGGLASSYSPAYQLTLLGQHPEDMALAARRVMELRGGMCLVEDGVIVWELPLERGGLFTDIPWRELVQRLDQFEQLMRERGYRHGELLYSMFFFGFDSLPDFRLTTRGIWDVRRRRVVVPPQQLMEVQT